MPPPALRRKAWALLAYLATTSQAHYRHTLASLFCQEAAVPTRALRLLLSRIRRQLGSDIIVTEGDTVQFNRQAARVDSLEFEQRLARNLSEQTAGSLVAVIDLYRGEFLQGLTLPDAPEFEFWLLGQRARLRHLYERGLAEIVARFITQGEYDAAIQHAQQIIQSNPLLEEAHAHLIWLYGRMGRRQAALAQYEQCQALLQRELAVEPAPELRALRDEIIAGKLGRPRSLPTAVVKLDSFGQQTGDFVGRAAEMTRLREVWDSVQPGRSLTIILAAEAGMGKTRLIHEFAATIPEAGFLVGDCYESARALSYAPWLELLETQLGRLDLTTLEQISPFALDDLTRLIPALGRRLKRERPASLPPQARRLPVAGGELSRLFIAVSEFLLELPGTVPLLIFLDNLQWADEASLQLFHFLTRRSPPGKVLFIGAFRPEEAGDTAALQLLVSDLQHRSPLQLSLSPLTPEAITGLVGQLCPGLVDDYHAHLGNLLFKTTGGNALFVSEILRELGHMTELPETLPVPKSVSELIQRRLYRLPGSGRQVVEAIAVLDAPASLDQAQQTSGRSQEETIAAIDLALHQGLLQSQSATTAVRYDFSHDLIRRAVIGQLSHIRRQLLHRRAAATLEQAGAPAAALAYHWQIAGDVAKEGYYAALAGEEAAAIYANEEATRYLRRAIDLITVPHKRALIMRQLGEALQMLGRYQEAEEVYGQALAETAADRGIQAYCRVALGRLARLKSDYTMAMMWLEQARADYEALDDQQGMAETLWGMGAVYWSQLDYAHALACFREQLEIARRLDDQQGIGKAVGSMAVVYTEQGDYVQALRCYSQRLQIDLALNDRLSLAKTAGNMGMVYAGLGDYAHALACYLFLLKVTLELDDRQNVLVATGNMISVYTAQGEYAIAGRLSRQAITLGRALNLPLYLCEFLHARADLLARQERQAEAIALCDEAAAMAAGIGRTDIQLPARLLSVRLRLQMGEIDTAMAVKTLKSLRDAWPEEHQQAAILYELWRLNKSATSLCQQTAVLYNNLYAKTPDVTYCRRYEKLTGDALPAPFAAPLPPEVVVSNTTDLEMLLVQVDRLIAGLAGSA